MTTNDAPVVNKRGGPINLTVVSNEVLELQEELGAMKAEIDRLKALVEALGGKPGAK